VTEVDATRQRLDVGQGDEGRVILDLQLRLTELDLSPADPPGIFGPSTAEALRGFQGAHGIAVTGRLDQRTWGALVEAGYRLGDRLLYRKHPMLRGDDIAELQRRLSALGFDPGRIDAIFGDATVRALMEFQRNTGLPVDGICGPSVLEHLDRLNQRDGGGDLVTPLRERLRAVERASRSLPELRIAIGEHGGFAPAVETVCRLIREAGATALELHDPDPSRQASAANIARVDCYIGLRIVPDQITCTTAYYRGFSYESATSRRLAEIVQAQLPLRVGVADGRTLGIALPILRETQMPAIEIQLGTPSVIVQRTIELARVLVDALATWTTETPN
jgi:N-acetylmuramoyl-L-alanine amidase